MKALRGPIQAQLGHCRGARANYAWHNWRVLLDDVQATLGLVPAMLALRSISLRRTALHLPLRRSERGLLYLCHRLLERSFE